MDEKNLKKEMERMKDKTIKIMIYDNSDQKNYVKQGNIYQMIYAKGGWQLPGTQKVRGHRVEVPDLPLQGQGGPGPPHPVLPLRRPPNRH